MLTPERLPTSDQTAWSQLSPTRRKLAALRIDAIEQWHDGKIAINEASQRAKVSVSRFYRLAASWRDHPSLASLAVNRGSGAAARTRETKGDAVNALQAVVAKVVRAHGDASVAQLTRRTVEASGIDIADVPSPVILRRIVESELRRVKATGQAGHELRFDCSAVSAPQANGRPWIIFAILDVGTRLILGMSVADSAVAMLGYRDAARDAVNKLDGLPSLEWATRLTEVDIKSGCDKHATAELVERLNDAVAAHVQHADSDARFGRYLKALVGDRFGPLSLTPARTLRGDALPPNGNMTAWDYPDIRAALEVAVTQHNETVLQRFTVQAAEREIVSPDVLAIIKMTAA